VTRVPARRIANTSPMRRRPSSMSATGSRRGTSSTAPPGPHRTPADAVSGVRVGDMEYRGYPASGAGLAHADPTLHLAFFALLHDQDLKTPIAVFARDEAGNEATAPFVDQVFESLLAVVQGLRDDLLHGPDVAGRGPPGLGAVRGGHDHHGGGVGGLELLAEGLVVGRHDDHRHAALARESQGARGLQGGLPRLLGGAREPVDRERRLRQAGAPVVAIACGHLGANKHGSRAEPVDTGGSKTVFAPISRTSLSWNSNDVRRSHVAKRSLHNDEVVSFRIANMMSAVSGKVHFI